MRLHSMLPIACVCLALQAQTDPALASFERNLGRFSGAVLVPLGEAGKDRAKELENLLMEDELLDLGLSLWSPTRGKEALALEPLLRAKFKLGSGIRWIVLDPKGTLLASGAEAPKAQALADGLLKAGLTGRLSKARAFVKQNPEHLEGRIFLLGELHRVAIVRTHRTLFGSVPQNQISSALLKGTAETKELDQEADLLIWGSWTFELERLLNSGDWLLAQWLPMLDPTGALSHSPMVKTIFRRHLPKVEDALRRWPQHGVAWNTWVAMVMTLRDHPIKAFMDSLTPLPGTPPEAWPPQAVRMALVQEARRLGRWGDVVEFTWPTFAAVFDQPDRRTFLNDTTLQDPQAQSMLDMFWQSFVEPLLEACLRAGDTGKAEQVVSRLLELGWASLPSKASPLAQRCGKPDLAARWAALKTK